MDGVTLLQMSKSLPGPRMHLWSLLPEPVVSLPLKLVLEQKESVCMRASESDERSFAAKKVRFM